MVTGVQMLHVTCDNIKMVADIVTCNEWIIGTLGVTPLPRHATVLRICYNGGVTSVTRRVVK